MQTPPSIHWNPNLRLVFADVDDTVAALYRPATAAMLTALGRLLERGVRIAFITGQGVAGVERRVVMNLPASLRRWVAVGGCSGAELYGYSALGERNSVAFDSAEDALSAAQKAAWRDIIRQLIDEFHLIPHPSAPFDEFVARHGEDPWHIILEDRGPQITLEFPSAFQLTEPARERVSRRIGFALDHADLRMPMMARAGRMLQAAGLPVFPRLAGEFALDFAIAGMSKARVVEKVLSGPVREALGLERLAPDEMEVWGDRFSQTAGTDWLMCTPLDRGVRAISFRDEDPAEFPKGYNVRLWDGAHRLHDGLLEFLESAVSNLNE
jgi:hypothetical protein